MPLNKSFRVVVIGFVQHRLSDGLNLLCQPIVDGVGGEQSQAAVTVFCVVPVKEGLQIGARFLPVGETPGI